MWKNPRNTERVKSLALFVLFTLSLYLVKALWAPDLMLALNAAEQAVPASIEPRAVILPGAIVYSYGNGTYNRLYADTYNTWDVLENAMVEGLSATPKLSEVEPALYDKYRTSRSIAVEMPFALSLGDLKHLIGLELKEDSLEKQAFSELLILSGRNNGIFIKDGNACFRLDFGTYAISLDQEIAEAENYETGRYKTVEDVYRTFDLLKGVIPGLVQNSHLIPQGRVTVPAPLGATAEYSIVDAGVLRDLVAQYFGTRVVKKLVDIDGSLVYLYGYGEKALKVSENGAIEFTAKLQSAPVRKIALHEALEISLSFIERYGGIPTGIRLSDYTVTEDNGRTDYHFTFTQHLPDMRILGEGQEVGIQMVLSGEQVVAYKRFIVVLDAVPSETVLQLGSQSIDDLINMNFSGVLSPNYLNDHPEGLIDAGGTPSQWHIFEVLQNINAFESLYYLDLGESMGLIPVWKIGFDQYDYYFNVNTGAIIKTERKVIPDGLVQN